MAAWKLPLLLLLATDAARVATAADYDYLLAFEIDKIEVGTSERLRSWTDSFKTDFAEVLRGSIPSANDDKVVVKSSSMKLSFDKLTDALTSNALQVAFVVGADAASKPTFKPAQFAVKALSDLGIGVRTAHIDGDVAEAFGATEYEGGEDPLEMAPAPPNRELSARLSHFFAIVGIIFIGVLLCAGYLIDYSSAKKARSSSLKEGMVG